VVKRCNTSDSDIGKNDLVKKGCIRVKRTDKKQARKTVCTILWRSKRKNGSERNIRPERLRTQKGK